MLQTGSSNTGSLAIGTHNNVPLYLGTDDVARITITGAGGVGIGTTTPAVTLAVVGDARVGTSGTNGCLQNFAGTALAGTCSSDARLKNVVGNVSDVLDKLTSLQLVKFRWNGKAAGIYHDSTTALNTGFLAQAVETQFPELVGIDRLGYRQLDYTTLSLYGIEAIKELKSLDDRQTAQIAFLKSRLDDENQRLAQAEARMKALSATSDRQGPQIDQLRVISNRQTELIAQMKVQIAELLYNANTKAAADNPLQWPAKGVQVMKRQRLADGSVQRSR